MSTEPRRRRLRFVALFFVVLSGVMGAPSPSLAGGAGPGRSVRILGAFPAPPNSSQGYVVHVDPVGRRAYYMFARENAVRIAEYDIDRPVPRLLREADLGTSNPQERPFASPYVWTIDRQRHRLMFLQKAPGDSHSVVRILDLRTFHPIASPAGDWEFNDPNRLPGFFAFGMTYAPQDDRIYLVGSMLYGETVQTFVAADSFTEPVVVVALDAGDGSLQWARPVPECQMALYENFKGSAIIRSQIQDALYFMCTTGAAKVGLSNYPGHAGVLRLAIDPKGTGAEALGFRADFFAISGSYGNGTFSGAVAFDPKTDRVFLQSLSVATPGAWVFDGRIQGWAGFISAPGADWGKPEFFGINTRTGQYYMGGGGPPGFMVVTNDRASPIPQGNVYEGFQAGWFIHVDERSGRLFVLNGAGGTDRWVVVQDLTPAFLLPESADFDALTSNIDEGPNTEVTFVSGVSGYGARATLVGGWGGMWSGVFDPTGPLPPDTVSGVVRPTDRAVILANVPSVDLRSGSSAAAAQAGSLDADSDSDLGAARNSVESQQISPLVVAAMRELVRDDRVPPALRDAVEAAAKALEENVGPRETTSPVPETRETAASKLEWPWLGKTCLDGGDEKKHEEADNAGGSVSITCDATRQSADASARWGRFVEGPVSIASTSFESRGWRDPKTGASTLITATADGIKIALEGIGTLKIGHIESTVGTLARGRPGTAKATWASVIEQVRVLDAAGNVVPVPQACDDQESCRQLAADVTHALMGRIRLYVPEAHVESTEKGAFATVEKRFEDFLNDSTVNNDQSRAVPALQIEIYKDGVERSRLLLQFAAIQANSIYTISPRLEPPPIEPPPIIPDSGVIPGQIHIGDPVPGTEGSNTAPQPGGIAGIPGILALLVRSPLEALHAAGVWLLFGAAVFGVVRRRMFHGQLSQGDQ